MLKFDKIHKVDDLKEAEVFIHKHADVMFNFGAIYSTKTYDKYGSLSVISGYDPDGDEIGYNVEKGDVLCVKGKTLFHFNKYEAKDWLGE